MYAITGVTGTIGGIVASNLLTANLPVRAIVRNPEKARAWADRGCELAQADIFDSVALTNAFQGAEAVFILVPPLFDPASGFPEAHAIAASLKSALSASCPARTVYLSTIGAQATQINLLTQHTIIERELRTLSLPITFLRPAWFLENFAWDVAPARVNHLIHSFLQPLDRPLSMVGTADIGDLAAELLRHPFTGHQTVELEGPALVTPQYAAATLAELLGHPVNIEAVPRESWLQLFESQGMKNPTPRIHMLDGFNEGWIRFEGAPSTIRKGKITLRTVLQSLLKAKPE